MCTYAYVCENEHVHVHMRICVYVYTLYTLFIASESSHKLPMLRTHRDRDLNLNSAGTPHCTPVLASSKDYTAQDVDLPLFEAMAARSGSLVIAH